MKSEELTDALSSASPRECAKITKKLVALKLKEYEETKNKKLQGKEGEANEKFF